MQRLRQLPGTPARPMLAGGGGYFAAPSFPQAAWQGAQYGGQYGMNPAAASMQAAMQAGASGQQGMPGSSGGMGGGPGAPQQGGGSGPYGAAAAGAPKPAPGVTPPRVRTPPGGQAGPDGPLRRSQPRVLHLSPPGLSCCWAGPAPPACCSASRCPSWQAPAAPSIAGCTSGADPLASPRLAAHPPLSRAQEKKILRLENPDTHEVIDLSKPMAGGQPASATAAKPADKKGAAPAAPPAKAAEKKAEAGAPAPKTAAEVVKSGQTKAAAEAAAAAALKPKAVDKAEAAAADAPAAADKAPAAADKPAAEQAPAAAEKPAVEQAPAAADEKAPPQAAADKPAAAPAEPAAAAEGAKPAPPAKPAAPAPKWGAGPSFKDKLMVDPAEKRRQEEEAARKRAAEEAAARKKAEEEAAKKRAEEEAKRKVGNAPAAPPQLLLQGGRAASTLECTPAALPGSAEPWPHASTACNRAVLSTHWLCHLARPSAVLAHAGRAADSGCRYLNLPCSPIWLQAEEEKRAAEEAAAKKAAEEEAAKKRAEEEAKRKVGG